MAMMDNKCESCKYCKIIVGGFRSDHLDDEMDCRLEMWDYFLEDIPCPQYVEREEEYD